MMFRLWGMMAAVAKMKQAVKAATEAHDVQQLQQRLQQSVRSSVASASHISYSPWDFHPLTGGLMDAVITVYTAFKLPRSSSSSIITTIIHH